MAWLHTWSGLVVGWALYMMFLAGTASVFKDEISTWMRPEIPRATNVAEALTLAERRLVQVAPDAQRWSITLPDDRDPTMQIAWRPRESNGDRNAADVREVLSPTTGMPLTVRETRGGDLFYRLHYRFEFQGRNGWWFSGAAAVVMLVSLVCGVIIHKRIFNDFFTFRSRSSKQRAWLDAHNLLAVVLLPFHFVITYTGLVPIMSTVMPWAIVANYAEGSPSAALHDYDSVRNAYSRDLRPDDIKRDYAGERAPLASLNAVRIEAERRWEGVHVGRINVLNPGDKSALIELSRHERGQISNRSERLFFDGVTGVYAGASSPSGGVSQVSAVMYGLHMVRFADATLRWIVFVVGLAGSAMIATGSIVWVTKRAPAGAHIPYGYALVERLNVAGIIGLPIAMCALFWANRLLPLHLDDRAIAETRAFFLAWIAMLVLAFVRPRRSIWSDPLWIAVGLFGALPFLNALTTDRHLIASLRDGDALRAGFDLSMLGFATIFAYMAVAVRRAQRSGLERHTGITPALREETA